MMHTELIPCGVGVIIKRGTTVLLGKRISRLGQGTWAPPGGLIEPGESIEQCARREVFEETGFVVCDVAVLTIIDTLFEETQHYGQSIMVETSHPSGTFECKEPDKCEQWAWFEWTHLPRPLFSPFQSFVNQGLLSLVFDVTIPPLTPKKACK